MVKAHHPTSSIIMQQHRGGPLALTAPAEVQQQE